MVVLISNTHSLRIQLFLVTLLFSCWLGTCQEARVGWSASLPVLSPSAGVTSMHHDATFYMGSRD